MADAPAAPRTAAKPSSEPLLVNDRFFAAIPLPPALVGALLMAGTLLALYAMARISGDLEQLNRMDDRWWQLRDVRVPVLLTFLVAYLPTARHYASRWTQRNLADLRAAVRWPEGRYEANVLGDPLVRTTRARLWTAGSIGMLMVPLIALLVDRDPRLYLTAEYWRPVAFFTWIIGGTAGWHAVNLLSETRRRSRHFSSVGRTLPELDLLALDRLTLFGRQAVESILPGLIVISFALLNLGDRDFVIAVALLVATMLAWTAASVSSSTRGIRERIRAEKRLELARVNAAIRGDTGALAGSPLGSRRDPPGLSDLLAWRSSVEALREWPFDTTERAQLLLYLAIPIGSWVGGAFVERAIGMLIP